MNSYVRFFNSVKDFDNVKIMMGDIEVTKALSYPRFTEYFKCVVGTHKIFIYKDEELLYTEEVFIEEGEIITFCVAGNCMFFDLFKVVDKKENHSNTVAEMRFVNLVPFDTKYNIFMDNKEIVTGLEYREVSDFQEYTPKKYKMSVTDYYSDFTKVVHPNAIIKDRYIYTTYIVGKKREKNGLLLVNSLEGSTYIID